MPLIPLQNAVAPPQRITPLELYHEWLDQLGNDKTREAYAQGWKFFAVANETDLQDAVESFFSDGPIEADSMCAKYKTWLLRRIVSGNTINLRFSAISCLLKYARRKRLLFWDLDLKRASSKPVRDTRGPDEETTQKLFDSLEDELSTVAIRNLAMARLAYNPALRSFEVLGLDLEHVDLQLSRVNVMGKARGGSREWVTMPPTTKDALEDWIEMRPDVESKAVFVALEGGHYGKRLERRAIRNVLLPFGVRPHGLRHSAITKALDLTDGDIRAVQKFSRHASPNQVLAYDDCRRDLGGQISNLLDESEGTTEEDVEC